MKYGRLNGIVFEVGVADTLAHPVVQEDPNTPGGDKVWIFPLLMCSMWFINDARRTATELPGQPTRISVNPNLGSQNNLRFRDFARPISTLVFCSSTVVKVNALCNTEENSKLFVCYGEKFTDFLMLSDTPIFPTTCLLQYS